jgi:tight adherence protein B
MASNAFLLLSLALLIAAAAMALWMLVSRQQKTHRMTRHLEQSLEKARPLRPGLSPRMQRHRLLTAPWRMLCWA